MAEYKIEKDPITGRVLSITKIQANIPVYSTDIILDESGISNIEAGTPMLITDDLEFVHHPEQDACIDEMQTLNEKIYAISGEGDYDYFMKMVLEGMDLAEARDAVKSRTEELETLKAQLEEKKLKHEGHVREYYLAQNKAKDELLDCKYYSAVVLVIKDENRYLKEWIDWHLGLEFGHIYIYDNGSRERVTDIINGYEEEMQQNITVIDWTGHHNHIQQDAYNHFMENYKADVRWGLFIDSDEFLRFTDGETEDVNAFLKGYEDYTEIWGYEVEYDANGKEAYEDKPVRERFTRQTDVREGFYWKNFIQVNRIDSFKMHYAYYDPAKHQVFENEERNKDLFVIDHYYTKSWEEWQRKIKERGGADPNYHKVLKEFFLYNPDMAYLDTGEDAVQAYE